MNIVLIGYRGSGKTTIGRNLAYALGRPFVDLDDRIVAAAGMSIREIFARHGEAHFRRFESLALHATLADENQVIAPGGGVILWRENRRKIAAGSAVIYLHCHADVLARRIAADVATADARPSLTGGASASDEVAAVLAVREPIYRSLASSVLDVSALSLDDAKAAALQSATELLAKFSPSHH
jgi:shikimate kinase